jgi:hypothetical protein
VKRRSAELESQTPNAAPPAPKTPVTNPPAVRAAITDIGRYGQHLENRYVAARDAWTQAMRAATSGRPADMASLAIAQEAYETVVAEREHWLSSGRVAIPVEPAPKRNEIEVAVGQELEWRRVLEREAPRGLVAWIRRRLGGR